MMKNIFTFCFLSFIVVFQSCQEQSKTVMDADGVLVINFEVNETVDPSELLTAEYVKLETTDSSFIDRSIVQLEYTADKIFILSGGSNRNLYVFDKEGKFLQSIGRQGNGPGEFVVPMSFSFDAELNVISIVDIGQQKIIEFDLDKFNFSSEKKLNFYSKSFEYVKSGKLLLHNVDSKSSHKDWAYILADSSLNLESNHIKKELVTGYSTGHIKNTFLFEGDIYAYTQYNPFIYRFDKGEMKPVYRLQFGKFNLPPMDYLNEISANNVNFLSTLDVSDYIYYYCFFETGNIVNTYYTVAQEAYMGLYDKKKDQTYAFSRRYFEEKMRVGEMDRPVGMIGDFMVAPLQPFDLRDKLAEGYAFEDKLRDLIEQSRDDDNPILFLYRFK